MNHADIPFLTATELAGYIKSKDVSPVEALEAYLARIGEVDGKLNSFITICAEQALDNARLAEAEISRGGHRGPLHGIPVAVKDQIHTAGIRTTDASHIREDFVPETDATVIKNLKNAGAVLIGKLNMSEFALGDPVSSAFGPARNPWDLERSPGVSSTGSGAATAGFLCATSLGEDTGGSIRGPAANCGLVGLRPSWGRVSRFGVDGACWSIDTIGPLSRSVADCAATIQAIAGHDPKDPYTWQAPVPDYPSYLTGDIRDVRVGLVSEFLDGRELEVDPQTRDAVLEAAEVLKGLGAQVLDVSLPLARHTGAIIRTISHTERVSTHPTWLRRQPEGYHRNTRIAFTTGNLIPAQVYYKAQKLRALVRQQVLKAFQDVDVLISPTSSGPAGKINMSPVVQTKGQAKNALTDGSFRGIFSLTGGPALSIRCGFTSSQPGGLPLALQIAGRPFQEATVLRVAHAYEQNTDWDQRRPPV